MGSSYDEISLYDHHRTIVLQDSWYNTSHDFMSTNTMSNDIWIAHLWSLVFLISDWNRIFKGLWSVWISNLAPHKYGCNFFQAYMILYICLLFNNGPTELVSNNLLLSETYVQYIWFIYIRKGKDCSGPHWNPPFGLVISINGTARVVNPGMHWQ